MALQPQIVALSATFRGFPERLIDIARSGDERARMQRDALLAFSIRVASAGMLYLSQILLARWMGSFEYGIYVFVWTWVLVLGGLCEVGLSVTAIRLIPEYRETGQLALLRGLLIGGRLVVFALATSVALGGMLALWLFGDQLAHYTILPLFLGLICLPLFTVGDFQDGIGRGQAWMISALLPPYVLRPVLVLAAMVGAWLAGLEMTATTAAGAAIFATWTAALVQMLVLHVKLRRVIPAGPRAYDVKGWLTMAFPLLVISFCEILLQNADVLIISRYVDPAQVGIYFAAAKTMSLIMFVHYAVGSAVANRYSALNARGDKAALTRLVRDAGHWTFWPSLAGAVVILAIGKPLLSLFGAGFAEGYPVMFILVMGFLVRASIGPAEFLLTMLGEQRNCAIALIVGAAISIALNFTLTPMFGLIGAAMATATAVTVTALLNCWFAWRRLGIAVGIWSNLTLPARP